MSSVYIHKNEVCFSEIANAFLLFVSRLRADNVLQEQDVVNILLPHKENTWQYHMSHSVACGNSSTATTNFYRILNAMVLPLLKQDITGRLIVKLAAGPYSKAALLRFWEAHFFELTGRGLSALLDDATTREYAVQENYIASSIKPELYRKIAEWRQRDR